MSLQGGKCLERTLMQWNSLQSYFLSDFDLNDDPIWSDPDEKPSREKRLVNAFKQSVSKMYVMFLQSVIPIFDSFNTFLPVEEPLIYILYHDHSTLRLYYSLLSRFILLEFIWESLMSWKILTVYLMEQWPSSMQRTVT